MCAVDGHVFHFNTTNISADHNTRNWPMKIGVNDASVFTGFCAFHDQSIFRPIENEPFECTGEQLLLYAYRALCREIYTREFEFEMIKAPALALKARVGDDLTSNIEETIELNNLTSAELLNIKDSYDQLISSKLFNKLDHLVLACPKPPDIFGTAFIAPHKNFQYNQIQDTKTLLPVSWIAMTMLPSKNGGGMFII